MISLRRLFPSRPIQGLVLASIIVAEAVVLIGKLQADTAVGGKYAYEGGWSFDRMNDGVCHYVKNQDICTGFAPSTTICYDEWLPGHYAAATHALEQRNCGDGTNVSAAPGSGYSFSGHQSHTRN